MDIETAKRLKYGDKVNVPADRGQPGYVGTVYLARSVVYEAHNAESYVWVTVIHPDKATQHAWPSNRLS